MSILHPDSSGVKPEAFDVHHEQNGGDPCGCQDDRAVDRWEALDRLIDSAIEQLTSIEDLGCEEPDDMSSIDRVDYAYLCGFHLGFDLVSANPPRDYSDAEVEAWFGGYHDGRAAGIQDVLDEIERHEQQIRILDTDDPLRTWNEAEIAAARSNGGHPSWEN